MPAERDSGAAPSHSPARLFPATKPEPFPAKEKGPHAFQAGEVEETARSPGRWPQRTLATETTTRSTVGGRRSCRHFLRLVCLHNLDLVADHGAGPANTSYRQFQ